MGDAAVRDDEAKVLEDFPSSLLIWEQLKPFIPPPEVSEIESIFSRHIDANQAKLDHIRAMYRVLLDIESRNDQEYEEKTTESTAKANGAAVLLGTPQRVLLQQRIDMLIKALQDRGRLTAADRELHSQIAPKPLRPVRSAEVARRARTATPRPNTDNGDRSLGLDVVGRVNVDDIYLVQDSIVTLMAAEAEMLAGQEEWVTACVMQEVDRHLDLDKEPEAIKATSTEQLAQFAATLEKQLNTGVKVLPPVSAARPVPRRPGLPTGQTRGAPKPVSRARQRLYQIRDGAGM